MRDRLLAQSKRLATVLRCPSVPLCQCNEVKECTCTHA